MKLLKLGLLAAVAVTAMMAFAGTASATTVTSGGTTYNGTIQASAGATNFTGSFVKVECSSSYIEGKVAKHGESPGGVTAPAIVGVSHLTFGGCNFTVTVLKAGSLSIVGSGSGNGTLRSSGAEISLHTSVGLCILKTGETHVGTLTGNSNPKIDFASAKIPIKTSNFLCGTSGTWNAPGGYSVSNPDSLFVD